MTRDELIEMHAKTDAMERVNMRMRILELEAAALFAHTKIAGYLSVQSAYAEEPLVSACQRLYAAMSPEQKRDRN